MVSASSTPKTMLSEALCPYCIVNDRFRIMTVLSNGRLICENCGHIVFPNDGAFRCQCLKCVEIEFSPKIRRLRQREMGPNVYAKAKTARRERRKSLGLYLRGVLSFIQVIVSRLRTSRTGS